MTRSFMDRIFETDASPIGLNPKFDIKENKEGFYVTVELPGISEKDVNVTVENGILTISGEKKSEETKEGESYFLCERKYGSFSRSIKLPFEPDVKQTSATFQDGVLKLTIPQMEASKLPVHKIEVTKQ